VKPPFMSVGSPRAASKAAPNLEKLNDQELALVDRFAGFLIETRTRLGARRRFDEAWAEWSKRTSDVTAAEIEALIDDAVVAVRAGV
jgi:hypothetical protein